MDINISTTVLSAILRPILCFRCPDVGQKIGEEGVGVNRGREMDGNHIEVHDAHTWAMGTMRGSAPRCKKRIYEAAI